MGSSTVGVYLILANSGERSRKRSIDQTNVSYSHPNIGWNDFMNLHNQYKDKVNEEYKLREDNIRRLHSKFFEQQMKEFKSK